MSASATVLNRRVALSGGIGAIAGVMAWQHGLLAQESTPQDTDSPEGGDRLLEGATGALAIVQTDRDAAAGSIDTASVDELIGDAQALIDRAATDSESPGRTALAAVALLGAAESLIRAQTQGQALPSHQGASSVALANVHALVKAASETLADSTDQEVTNQIAAAQALYGDAYNLYQAGEYEGAAHTALAAGQRTFAASILSGANGQQDGQRRAGHDRQSPHDRRASRGTHRPGEIGRLLHPVKPVAVPEPTF